MNAQKLPPCCARRQGAVVRAKANVAQLARRYSGRTSLTPRQRELLEKAKYEQSNAEVLERDHALLEQDHS